jgi:putative ABC transport system permease protein
MEPAFNFGQIWVKISPDNIPQTLNMLQSSFKKLLPYYPYSYQFMDDINAKNYETETKWKQIISIASALFIFVSCIGLLGTYHVIYRAAHKRDRCKKSIGRSCIKDRYPYLKRIYYSYRHCIFSGRSCWLLFSSINGCKKFAYRINIEWWMFALARHIGLLPSH